MKSKTTLCATALLSAALACPASLPAQDLNNYPGGPGPGGAPTATTVTNVTGTISQLEYGPDGTVEGFLVGSNTLLTFAGHVAAGIASLGAAQNSVTYSGSAVTTSSGFETVRVTSFKNNSTGATYTASMMPPTPTAYGPTSGTVTHINYAEDGTIDGFVFTPSAVGSTPVFVVTGSRASATLKPLLSNLTGTISVTGRTLPISPSTACTATGALPVVDATSLTIGSQTIVIAGGGGDFGGGGRGGHR